MDRIFGHIFGILPDVILHYPAVHQGLITDTLLSGPSLAFSLDYECHRIIGHIFGILSDIILFPAVYQGRITDNLISGPFPILLPWLWMGRIFGHIFGSLPDELYPAEHQKPDLISGAFPSSDIPRSKLSAQQETSKSNRLIQKSISNDANKPCYLY